MSNVLASIVVNNFNYGRFLRDAIDSALCQTYPRTEVIVVDDGSTDNSREIITAYERSIIPVLKENGGQGSAYNAGFRASHGDLVVFLDADDILFPEAVSSVVEMGGPTVAKVQYRLQILDEQGEPRDRYWPHTNRFMPSGDLKEQVLSHFHYLSSPGSGNAYSRRFLEYVLPMPENEWRICSDAYLFTLAVFYGDVVSINRPLGYHRSHGANNWMADDIPWRKNLAREVKHILTLEKLVQDKARELNLMAPPNLALRCPLHAEARVALRLLDPDRYPAPSESLPWLAWKAVRSIWTYYDFGLKRRVIDSIWLILMLVSPVRLASVWAEWLYCPRSRPRLLSRMLGASG